MRALRRPLGVTEHGLLRLQTVFTRRRERISSDEEERRRSGFELEVSFRFADRGDRPAASAPRPPTRAASRSSSSTHGDAATIRIANVGRRRRKDPADRGFWLDLREGSWLTDKQAADAPVDADDLTSAEDVKHKEKVIPYVEDRRNILVVRLTQAVSPTRSRSPSAPRSNAAIEADVPARGLRARQPTPCPTATSRGRMLLTEAAEGGAGVLRRLVDEPDALARVARQALEIIHYDPDTGADLDHAAGATERCERGCYDCLLVLRQPVRARQHRPAQPSSPLLQQLARRLASTSGAGGRGRGGPAGLARQARRLRPRAQVRRLARRDAGTACPTTPSVTVDRRPSPARLRLRPAGQPGRRLRRRPAPRRRRAAAATTPPATARRPRLERRPGRHDDDWAAIADRLRSGSSAPEGARPPHDRDAATLDVAVGSLVRARGREWVVLPGTHARLPAPAAPRRRHRRHRRRLPRRGRRAAPRSHRPACDDLGDAASTALLRTALRVGFPSCAGPFRSLAGISVSPRSYQYVPLLMALRQDTVRLLIADDVGIGKTIEAGLIAAELLAQGNARRLAVLCSPALAEQWQRELREKFGIDAELVLTSTVKGLERGLMLNESLFDRYPYVIVSTDFIKSDRRRHEFLLRCPELVIVDEAHNCVAGGGQGQRQPAPALRAAPRPGRRPDRHLILVTATPHSGNEEAFRNLLGLLDPELAHRRPRHRPRPRTARPALRPAPPRPTSATTSTRTPLPQRPGDPRRALRAQPGLPRPVRRRPRLRPRTGPRRRRPARRGRVRWWSALALLRALASSPRAAAATLRTRAGRNADGDAPSSEADALGRAGVLDSGDDEALEGIDVTPGALIERRRGDAAATAAAPSAAACSSFARRAAEL